MGRCLFWCTKQIVEGGRIPSTNAIRQKVIIQVFFFQVETTSFFKGTTSLALCIEINWCSVEDRRFQTKLCRIRRTCLISWVRNGTLSTGCSKLRTHGHYTLWLWSETAGLNTSCRCSARVHESRLELTTTNATICQNPSETRLPPIPLWISISMTLETCKVWRFCSCNLALHKAFRGWFKSAVKTS